MKKIRRNFRNELFHLPDGDNIDLSQVSKIGDIVIFSKRNGSKRKFMGFTIIFQNGLIKNIVLSYNEKNKESIQHEIQQIYFKINSLFQAYNFWR